jgi:hypothetical protein
LDRQGFITAGFFDNRFSETVPGGRRFTIVMVGSPQLPGVYCTDAACQLQQDIGNVASVSRATTLVGDNPQFFPLPRQPQDSFHEVVAVKPEHPAHPQNQMPGQ